ncbi:hypothetical protein RQP46_010458 [Phenoliferia psychrophenolica]
MAPATVATADLLASDDEDEDFVAGDSGDSDSDDSEQERPTKKAKVQLAPVEPVLTKAAVDDLWASFNAPEQDDAQPTASTSTSTSAAPKKIKITVEYQFVGETVSQEKEVLADSDEAKAWLAKQPKPKQSLPPPPPPQPSSSATTATAKGKAAEDALFGSSADNDSPSLSLPSPIDAAPKPKAAPPKRAKSGGLSSLAASLSKPAKLNTLEKSKLDWNKFVDKEDLSDDLTKARKDGYLEKQDFLSRTDARREEDYDKSKRARR